MLEISNWDLKQIQAKFGIIEYMKSVLYAPLNRYGVPI